MEHWGVDFCVFEFGSVVVPFYLWNEGVHCFQNELGAFLTDVRDHSAQILEVSHDEIVEGGSCRLYKHCEKFILVHQNLYLLTLGDLGLTKLDNSREPGLKEEYEGQIDLERLIFMFSGV